MRVALTEIVLQTADLTPQNSAPARFAQRLEIFIYERGTEVEATIYSAESGGEVIAQPFTTDGSGRINSEGHTVWVEEGSYDLSSAGQIVPWEAVRGDDLGGVTSVAGKSGAVLLDVDDVAEAASKSEIEAAEAKIALSLHNKGTKDCSTNPNYPAAEQGDFYIVSASGKIGGILGKAVDAGDWIICTETAAGGSQLEVGSKWDVLPSLSVVMAERERAEGVEATLAAKTPVDTVFEFPLIRGDEVSKADAEQNCTALQEAVNAAAEDGRDLFIGGGIIRLYGAVALPSGIHVYGVGRLITVLKSHGDYLSNGPLFNQPEVGGELVPVTDCQITDLEIDGDYESNAEFSKVVTFSEEVTPASTSISFVEDITKILSSSGRLVLVDPIGDNSGLLTYTGITGTHTIIGVEFVTKSNSEPFTQPAGTQMRQFNEGVLGLIRIDTFERLELSRLHVRRAVGYCIGLQGQPEEFAERPDKVYPKNNLTIRECTFSESLNSDGIDIKEQYGTLMEQVEAWGNHDKGINVRGRYQSYVNCRTWGNAVGYGLTTNRLEFPEPYAVLAENASITDTTLYLDTTEATTNRAALPSSGAGYLGCERIEWTGKTATTLTGVKRAVGKSLPAFHTKSSETSPCYVTADVAGADAIDASIAMLGCWSLGDDSTGIAITTAGCGTRTRVDLFGGGAFGCKNHGLLLSAVRGQMRATLHGGDYHDNGEGVRAVNVGELSIKGGGVHHNNNEGEFAGKTGDGLALVNCTNGAEVDCAIQNNTGYGIHFLANGSSDYVRHRGGKIRNNTLGNINNPPQALRHNSGPVFKSGALLGLIVPEGGMFGAIASTALTAKRLYFCRRVIPYDCTISTVMFELAEAATKDVACYVAIYDEQFNLIAKSAKVMGKLNGATGDKEVALETSVELFEGAAYYVALVSPIEEGTAPKLRTTSSAAGLTQMQGGGKGNIAMGIFNEQASPPNAIEIGSATGVVPILALRF